MSQKFDLEGHDLSALFDLTNPAISFAADCKDHIPEFGSIIYTIWDPDDQFMYVGIGGTGKTQDKRKPRSRINQHASGGRSGDQFCIYVHDFFVLPQLISSGEYEAWISRPTDQGIHPRAFEIQVQGLSDRGQHSDR